MKDIFYRIFKENRWGSKDSVSGPGSTIAATKELTKTIPVLIEQFQIKSVLDASCGDFNWMRHVPLNVDSYIGVDIVPEIIANNNQYYSNDKTSFTCLDISKDSLPQADLIICRDCLVHFTFEEIFAALRNLRNSSSKYILMTTFPHFLVNRDIKTGEWRYLNFELEPFNFPKPIHLINEIYDFDKHLGLWELSSLTL